MSEQQAAVDAWAQPQDIDPITRAFPAQVIGTLIPIADDVPTEFWSSSNVWNRWAQAFFSTGWPMDYRDWARDGIDPEKATVHLHTALGSFEPKHEHKLAAVSYLASRWFDNIQDES